ncbi:MAG: hypothetical protein JWM95_3687 [Gemmatimonadetes bacterium]|nr:hypothetical protein [Gemmatimonadota bacterium]
MLVGWLVQQTITCCNEWIQIVSPYSFCQVLIQGDGSGFDVKREIHCPPAIVRGCPPAISMRDAAVGIGDDDERVRYGV